MKKVLLAYDGLPGSETAIDGLQFAGLQEKSEIRVMTVADVWVPPDSVKNAPQLPMLPPPARVHAREEAMKALLKARDISIQGAEQIKSRFPQWRVTHVARTGSPAWMIVDEAHHWPADLVIVGTHGHSKLHRFFLGSVSQKVAAEVDCSVRLVRGLVQKQGGLRVVLAVDGSDHSLAAVEEVVARSWPGDATFEIVTVIDSYWLTANAVPGFSTQDGGGNGDSEWISRMAMAHGETLRNRGFKTEVHILEGDPKGRVISWAETAKADCLFLGAQGMETRSIHTLGTFANAMASRAHCTVEIIRAQKPVPPNHEASAVQSEN